MRDIFTLTKPRPVVWRNYSETKTHSYSIPFSFCGMKISKKKKVSPPCLVSPPVAPTTDGASLHFLYALYTKAVHTACSGNFLAPSPIPSNWDMIGWAVGGGGQLGGQSTPVCSCARLVFFFFFSFRLAGTMLSDFELTVGFSPCSLLYTHSYTCCTIPCGIALIA